MADDVIINPARTTNIFSSTSPQTETKTKVSSGKAFCDHHGPSAYILASEEGCQGSIRSVQMFEVQQAVRYSFYWPIVEFYGQDI
jgi:hypothetical protein